MCCIRNRKVFYFRCIVFLGVLNAALIGLVLFFNATFIKPIQIWHKLHDYDKLQRILGCLDKPYDAEIVQRGNFWILKNYILARHGRLRCSETITYTTHADYTYLDNLIPMLNRWRSPVSIAMYAPGDDFNTTLQSIHVLRDCLPDSYLVRQYVTFHIYFNIQHMPEVIPRAEEFLQTNYNCSMMFLLQKTIADGTQNPKYQKQHRLTYPINVGRNIAREAAITHFVLASDIELYPSPGLVDAFLEMIERNEPYLSRRNKPRVFPLAIFEVERNNNIPEHKKDLQHMLMTGTAIPFHKYICSRCHNLPKYREWSTDNYTNIEDGLGVFHIGKRMGEFVHWEPIYIGTNTEPFYDERLHWEGKSDKMSQGYILCILNYEFHILDNAFLVHRPGIKHFKRDVSRDVFVNQTKLLIRNVIYPELKKLYGFRKGCEI